MKKLIMMLLTLLSVIAVQAQPKKAWEFGAGISIFQAPRITDLMFYQDQNNNNVLTFDFKRIATSGHIYVAKELTNLFTLDFQGNVGGIDKKLLTHVELGGQLRFGYLFSNPNSPYIDPFIGAGIGHTYKGTHITYSGQDPGGVQWGMLGKKSDSHHTVSTTFRVGVNMWLNDNWGIRAQGKYFHTKNSFVGGDLTFMFRLGGKSKKPQSVIVEVPRPRHHHDKKNDKEDKEKIKEEIIETTSDTNDQNTEIVATEKIVPDMMTDFYFDFNSDVIKPEFQDTIKWIAEYMIASDDRFCISGFADAVGNASYNLELSKRRANAITKALIENGVSPEKLETKWHGSKATDIPAYGTSHAEREWDRVVTIRKIGTEAHNTGLRKSRPPTARY